jgi:hypothetical protein
MHAFELDDKEKRTKIILEVQKSIDLLVTPVFLRIIYDLLESLDTEVSEQSN